MTDQNHFLRILSTLAQENIAFSVHYPAKGSYVVTVNESLNNEQVQTMGQLGASMTPNGVFQILVVEKNA